MVRDRKRQKKFQKQLVAHCVAQPAKICQLEIRKPQQKGSQKVKISVNAPATTAAMSKF